MFSTRRRVSSPSARHERERKDEDTPENLFPERQTEDEPEDDEEQVDAEDVDAEAEEDEDELAAKQPEEEEEDQQEAALDLNQVVRVNVDGQPAEVSLQEALNGYVRSETFHRRLNQLRRSHSNIENERAVLAEERNYYATLTPALLQQLYSLQPQEPDWDKLYAEDPGNAAQLERQWRTYREKVQALAQEHEQTTLKQQQEAERQQAVFEDTQRRQLAAWVPEWADNKRWDRDRKSMIRTAAAVGYSEAELGQLRDARPTMILLWASRYLELMR